jgi:drug/metabolite transporter (DMT)-like permease
VAVQAWFAAASADVSLSSVELGELFGLLAAFAWGITGLLVRARGQGVSAIVINAVRNAISGLVFVLIWFFVSGREPVPAAAWVLLAVSMLTGLGLGDSLYFEALKRIGVTRAMPISMAYPVLASIGAVVLLHEAMGPLSAVGIALTLGGVYLVAARPSASLSDSSVASARSTAGSSLASASGYESVAVSASGAASGSASAAGPGSSVASASGLASGVPSMPSDGPDVASASVAGSSMASAPEHGSAVGSASGAASSAASPSGGGSGEGSALGDGSGAPSSSGSGAASGSASGYWFGVALAGIAAMSWSFSTLALGPALQLVDASTATAIRTPLASALLFAAAGRTGVLPQVARLRGSTLAAVVGTGVMSVASTGLFVWCVSLAGAGRAAVLTATSPLFAVPLSVLLLGEPGSWRILAGTVASVLGVVLLTQS